MNEIGVCEMGGGIERRSQNTRIRRKMLLHFANYLKHSTRYLHFYKYNNLKFS